MGIYTLAKGDSLLSKAMAVFFALALAISLAPILPAAAFAVEDDGANVEAGSDSPVAAQSLTTASTTYTLAAAPVGVDTLAGGETEVGSGIYYLTNGATGTISFAEEAEVTVIGSSWDDEGNSTELKYRGLNFVVGADTTLTIKNIYVDQTTNASTIDFTSNGTLKLAGKNLIDNDNRGGSLSVIHVPFGSEVRLDGTGTLYGYKAALASYIGGNANEANGTIIFDGGYWFIKGTQVGPIIGSDSSTQKGQDIIINGGELYLKGVARGALIGGSNQGKAGDVYVKGGLVELFEDFSGPAIGAGNAANAGYLYVTGGSLKTVLSSNSANSYGASAAFGGMPGVSWKAVKALNADTFGLLTFDVSNYITDMQSDKVNVYVDGGTDPFYSGRVYTYVTNEAKNPNEPTGTTMDNWLTNDEQRLVTKDDYGDSAYPFGKETGAGGSSLVPEENLYFALSKENHTLRVGDDIYEYVWDEDANDGAGAFVLQEEEAYQITTQPVDATAALKQTAAFTIATNDPDAVYRWEYSVDGGKTWGQSYLTGWKTPEFSFAVTAARADRLYRCKVTFSDGETVYSDTVSVVEPKADESIKVTATPEKASAKLKDTVEFKAAVEGAEDASEYTFLWYYSEDNGENWAQSYLGGWKTDTFTFAVTSPRADRIYRVKATAPNGAEIFSEPVSIELAS